MLSRARKHFFKQSSEHRGQAAFWFRWDTPPPLGGGGIQGFQSSHTAGKCEKYGKSENQKCVKMQKSANTRNKIAFFWLHGIAIAPMCCADSYPFSNRMVLIISRAKNRNIPVSMRPHCQHSWPMTFSSAFRPTSVLRRRFLALWAQNGKKSTMKLQNDRDSVTF